MGTCEATGCGRAVPTTVQPTGRRLCTECATLEAPHRGNVETKGRAYLCDARLTVTHVNHREIRASCRGHGEVYQLGYHDGHWHCDCPARGRCAHLTALMLVTVRPNT
jgi:hypothetical protein